MKEHKKYAVLGLRALRRASAKVAENARKNNYKIPIWKNGRIEYEIPEISTEQASAPDAKSRCLSKNIGFFVRSCFSCSST